MKSQGLTVITPTGDRPESFELCEKWMSRQTFIGDIQWIVVDDGRLPTNLRLCQQVIRLPHDPTQRSTQHRNLTAGIQQAKHNFVVILEDDDSYQPGYLQRCHSELATHGLVGEAPSRYYNVRTRTFKTFENTDHASLCQTAFRMDMVGDLFLDICADPANWIDVELWGRFSTSGIYQGRNVVGIKGMPGRPGVSRAHNGRGAGWQADIGKLSRLQQWIGNDADLYTPFWRP